MIKPPSSSPAGAAKLLTLQQVANITSFSVRQVRRWIESGELAACHFGRALRVADIDLAIFITKKKHP